MRASVVLAAPDWITDELIDRVRAAFDNLGDIQENAYGQRPVDVYVIDEGEHPSRWLKGLPFLRFTADLIPHAEADRV